MFCGLWDLGKVGLKGCSVLVFCGFSDCGVPGSGFRI